MNTIKQFLSAVFSVVVSIILVGVGTFMFVFSGVFVSIGGFLLLLLGMVSIVAYGIYEWLTEDR